MAPEWRWICLGYVPNKELLHQAKKCSSRLLKDHPPDTKGTPSTKHYRMMKATAVVDHITEAFEKLTGAHDAHSKRTEDMYISYSAQTIRQHCVPFLERESRAVGAHLRQD